MNSGSKVLFQVIVVLVGATFCPPHRAEAQQARLPAAAHSAPVGVPPALPLCGIFPGIAAPLGSAASYEALLRRQGAGEVLDLSGVTRPGIAFVSGEHLLLAQGSGRFEALRAGERMDLFVAQDQDLPEGVSVVERDIPADLALKANLLSSRGESGSNPALIGVLTDGRTFVRVLAPRGLVEAPFSRAVHEVEQLRAFLTAGARGWGEDAQTGLDGYWDSPSFRDLSLNAQWQTLRRMTEAAALKQVPPAI